MARNLNAKCRLCRRAGVKLFLKGERCFTSKCAIVKRNYPPGAQGAKGKPKVTGYGIQLREKQKAKQMYGISETQFSGYFAKASNKEGNTADLMLQMLEMRLDNVVYRLGWAPSRDHARQLVNHGHFMVDGKRVDIPSFQVRVGQVIAPMARSRDDKHFQELPATLEKAETPQWLVCDKAAIEGKVASVPTYDMMAPAFDMKSIIEFYSR